MTQLSQRNRATTVIFVTVRGVGLRYTDAISYRHIKKTNQRYFDSQRSTANNSEEWINMMQALSHEDQTVNTLDVLSRGIEQLKEEHIGLKYKLMEFYGMAKVIGADEDVSNWSGSLDNLRRKITEFMGELDVHSEWEDQVLFPMVQEYTGKDMGPIAVMEYEHELAKQSVRRFLDAAGQLQVPVNCEAAKEAASHLLQAYVILNDHFTKEEEILFPLAEQMLTDIEQFFS